MTLVDIVCGLNASRSQFIKKFLKDKYSLNPNIQIRASGMDVVLVEEAGENDKRILYTREMAEESNLIFAADHDKFYRIKHKLLNNNRKQIEKVHLLRIPDIFHIHKDAYFANNESSYEKHMQEIENEPEFKELIKYIRKLTSREASILTEALYTKELYSAHRSPELRQDKKYPFELLYKTLEFRFPWISKLIENTKSEN